MVQWLSMLGFKTDISMYKPNQTLREGYVYQTNATHDFLDTVYGDAMDEIIHSTKSRNDVLDATEFQLFKDMDLANKPAEITYPDRRLRRCYDFKVRGDF